DAGAHRKRAVLGLLEHVPCSARFVIAPLAQAACPREFSPIETEAVEPLTAKMVVDVLDVVSVGDDCEITALFRASRVARGEVQDAETVLPGKRVDAAVAVVIAKGRRDRVIDRCASVVFDRDGEERDRHRRVAVAVRDERAERRHPNLARKAPAMKLELGDRKTADERDVVKVGNSSHRVAIGAETKSIELARTWRTSRRPLVGPVQYPSFKQFAVLLRPDSKVAVAVELTDSRPVADAPVDQPATASQRHATASDAAQWKGDVSAPFAGVDETVVDGFVLLRHLVQFWKSRERFCSRDFQA